jgi:tricorn protease
MQIIAAFRRVAIAASVSLVACASLHASSSDAEQSRRGYYTGPAIHGDTIVFTSEGDLWTVGVNGGTAQRLTTGSGIESMAILSPDGKTIAFRASYEGPADVYTMPADGGLPQRQTWDGDARPVGWAPDGRLMISTARYSTLPSTKLVLIDSHGNREVLPLAEAAQASYSTDGRTLFFTRWYKQSSNTKRYKGGSAENIWRWDGSGEAVPLAADYTGTSRDPMFWNGRVYFLSDRDGVMNVYSMDTSGKDVREETHQHIFDIESASLSGGRIVYSCAADLWLLDLKSGKEASIPVTLQSDFDQMRQHWVEKPLNYLTSIHISPNGDRAVFTVRGEIYTFPAKPGRIVKVAGDSSFRYRDARFLPDGKSIVAVSTQTGETEFWKFPSNGEGAPEQWTHGAKVLRWDGIPSPDGHWLAHYNKDQELWIYDTRTKQDKRIAQSMNGDFSNLSWSPDSRWLSYVETADNLFDQIKILNVESGAIETITSDRFNSENPEWSADGKWLYFLSDRMLKTVINSPWGPRQPDPYFDRTVKIYELALTPGLRSPFLPPDELHPDTPEKETTPSSAEEKKSDQDKTASGEKTSAGAEKPETAKKPEEKKPPEVKIDFTYLDSRLSEIPAPPGNYGDLQVADKRLCWLNSNPDEPAQRALQCLDIANKGDPADTVMTGVRRYEISLDRKKILIQKADSFYIVPSDAKAASLTDPKALAKVTINTSGFAISTIPREEFHQIFLDAWRLERDYYYDRNMQGIDWPAMRDRYLPLVDRVADRDELNDVIAQMVSELSTLHTFVAGGDDRHPIDNIGLASLGARLRRDEKAGGFVVEHIYLHDPDLPTQAPPLARPESLVHEGETIVGVDGVDALSVPDLRELLRDKAGQQVMLRVKSASGETRDVLVKPVSAADDAQLRYSEWEYTRRLEVDKESNDAIGYVHLRAMGPNDIDQWARDFYPVFNRQGLIIDVRDNHGGNIDSWLLSKLIRQAWFYWQPRVGNPMWNMQYAFRGHIVVLIDHDTASDGEAFAEGFRRLNLGKVIGTRTWGGEIWLSGSNTQSDGGVATAAEMGVYGPDGKKWLIEGHGVDPDIVVDNLPHATFDGSDAQLQTALDVLKHEIQADPRPVPPHPPYPNKSFHYQQ